MRSISFKYLGDLSKTGFRKMLFERLEPLWSLQACGIASTIHFQVGGDEWTKQPWPYCALVVGAVTLVGAARVMIAITSFLCVITYISGFVALFRLRIQRPALRRPFKVWGYPWTVLGVLLVSAAFLVAAVIGDMTHSLFTVILVAAS